MLLSHRRSDVEVIADMLRIRGSKTAIMYGANLSYTQIQKYLGLLTERKFIESVDKEKGRRHYRPTQRGRELLDLIEQLEELITPSLA